MRIVFCGNPQFAVPPLEALLAGRHEIVAVVTSPDKPRGRGRKVSALPVKDRALEAGLPVYQPESLRDPAFLAAIREHQPDANVVVAFRILPRELFALPRLGSFNIHPSLLPRGRGPAPIRWTLLRGETETGVTIIQLSEEIDGGHMLRQERTDVLPDEDFGALHNRLSLVGAQMIVEVLNAFEQGTPPPPLPQDESLITKAPKIYPKDTEIDWRLTATEIVHRIRAFSPSPAAQTRLGETRFKILSASEVEEPLLEAGELLLVGSDTLVVGTGHGSLRLNVVQPEGKRAMSVADYLRGRPALPKRLGV